MVSFLNTAILIVSLSLSITKCQARRYAVQPAIRSCEQSALVMNDVVNKTPQPDDESFGLNFGKPGEPGCSTPTLCEGSGLHEPIPVTGLLNLLGVTSQVHLAYQSQPAPFMAGRVFTPFRASRAETEYPNSPHPACRTTNETTAYPSCFSGFYYLPIEFQSCGTWVR